MFAPLTICTLYRITDDEPFFLERLEEGDVAWYGWLLKQSGDPAFRDHLLASRVDDLWEYHRGYGVTAADSALAVEGLWSAGVAVEVLLPSLERLVAFYFDPAVGAFRTVLDGRANYWRGVSVETTAYIGYLLRAIAGNRFGSVIEACVAYTARSQNPDGSWPGKWFPSRNIPAFHALRLLRSEGDDRSDWLQRGLAWLRLTQGEGGDWGGSVIETSAAIMALAGDAEAAAERGREWLRGRRREDGWEGEPVLYYWFEEEDGSKIFFHCRDKGPITSAWAGMALDQSA